MKCRTETNVVLKYKDDKNFEEFESCRTETNVVLKYDEDFKPYTLKIKSNRNKCCIEIYYP